MRKLLFALIFLAATLVQAQPGPQTPHPAEAKPPIHNGLWWENKTSAFHDAFMTGYKSGAAHTAGHAIDINQFPVSELVDGLDHFYKDFRNRNIAVDDALNYTVDELRGANDDKLKATLLKLRASSAPAGVE